MSDATDGETDDDGLKGLMGDVAMVRFASMVAAFYNELVSHTVPRDDARELTRYMVDEIVAKLGTNEPKAKA